MNINEKVALHRSLVTTFPSDALALKSIAPFISSHVPSWDVNTDPCSSDWKGVSCDRNGNVISIDLFGGDPPSVDINIFEFLIFVY